MRAVAKRASKASLLCSGHGGRGGAVGAGSGGARRKGGRLK
jgi:hypothetical protein